MNPSGPLAIIGVSAHLAQYNTLEDIWALLRSPGRPPEATRAPIPDPAALVRGALRDAGVEPETKIPLLYATETEYARILARPGGVAPAVDVVAPPDWAASLAKDYPYLRFHAPLSDSGALLNVAGRMLEASPTVALLAVQRMIPEALLLHLRGSGLLLNTPMRALADGAEGILPMAGGVCLVLSRETENTKAYAVLEAIIRVHEPELAWPHASRDTLDALLETAYPNEPLPPSWQLLSGGGPSQDRRELESLESRLPPGLALPVVTLGCEKNVFDHAGAAAGLGALFCGCLALREKLLPPLSGATTTDANMRVDTSARAWFRAEADLRRVGITSVEPGGMACHWRLCEAASGRAPRTPIRTETLFLLGAPSPQAMLARIDDLIRRLETRPDVSAESLAQALLPEADGPARLAVRASDSLELLQKLRRIRPLLPEKGRLRTRYGIWYGVAVETERGTVAWLMPGQGAQQTGMMHDLALAFPSIRSAFDQLDATFAHPQENAVSTLLHPPAVLTGEQGEAVKRFLLDINAGGAAVVVGTLGLCDLLGRLGVPVDAMLGHSNGENIALVASGSSRIERGEYLQLLRELADFAREVERSETVPRGRSVAVSVRDRDCLADVVDGERVFLTMDNAPHQLVLFGDDEAMERAIDRLQEAGAICLPIPFDLPFHTPLFAKRLQRYDGFFARLRLRGGTIPLFSCYAVGPMPEESEAMLETIRNQLVHTVRFRETVERLHEDGVRTFLEVGPGNLLTPFVGDILRGRPHTALAMGAEPSLQSFLDGLGQLYVAGVPWNAEALLAEGSPEPASLDELLPPVRPASADEHAPSPTTAIPSAPPPPALPQRVPVDRAEIVKAHFELMNRFLESQARLHALLVARLQQPAASPRVRPPETAPSPTGTKPSAPLLGEVVERSPTRLVARRRLAAGEDRYLLDHCFGRAGKVAQTAPESGLPVQPMAFSIEAVAEAAVALLGGMAIRLDEVRGMRWLALDRGAVGIELQAERIGSEPAERAARVRVYELADEEARALVLEAVVVCADEYPAAPSSEIRPDAEARPPRVTVDEFYRYFLFHGPSLQGIRKVNWMDAHGYEAVIRESDPRRYFPDHPAPTLALEPLLLDCAGQLVAYWLVERSERHSFGVFPFAMERITIFARVAPETQVLCRGALRIENGIVHTRYEFITPDEQTIMLVEGGRKRLFDCPPGFIERINFPQLEARISVPVETQAPGLLIRMVNVLSKTFLESSWGIWQRVLAHVYLDEAERERYYAFPAGSPRRISYLLGRIAAKEAVTAWAWAHHGMLLGPADLGIDNDENGMPVVRCAHLPRPPTVSITHAEDVAAAACSENGRPAGVDLELPGARAVGPWLQRSFTQAELDRLPAREPETLLKYWCAKEAAAKASGLGLQGKPDAWEVVAVDSDSRCRVKPAGSDLEYVVDFRVMSNRVLAWTCGRSLIRF